MATRTATVTNVVKLRGPDPMITGEANLSVYALFLDNQTGLSIDGAADVFRIDSVVTSINSFVRDGKTRTMVGGQVSPHQHIVSSAGIAYGFTFVTSSAPQVDLVVKSSSDWSTNAVAAAGSFQQPAAIAVMVREV